MKALTIHNPYAWMIANGFKPAAHRGWIGIHASRSVDGDALWEDQQVRAAVSKWLGTEHAPAGVQPWEQAPGAFLAVAELVDICWASHSRIENECDCGPWALPGYYHWRLGQVQQLREPIRCRGRQRLWDIPAGVRAEFIMGDHVKAVAS